MEAWPKSREKTGCSRALRMSAQFNLGVESYDEPLRRFTYLLQGLADQASELPKIHWIEG